MAKERVRRERSKRREKVREGFEKEAIDAIFVGEEKGEFCEGKREEWGEFI